MDVTLGFYADVVTRRKPDVTSLVKRTAHGHFHHTHDKIMDFHANF